MDLGRFAKYAPYLRNFLKKNNRSGLPPDDSGYSTSKSSDCDSSSSEESSDKECGNPHSTVPLFEEFISKKKVDTKKRATPSLKRTLPCQGFSDKAVSAGLDQEWETILEKSRSQSTFKTYSGILAEACKRCVVTLKTTLLPLRPPSDLWGKLMVITNKKWAKCPKGHSWAYLNSLKHALAFHLRLESREEWLDDSRISLLWDSKRREGNNVKKPKFIVKEDQITALDEDAKAAWFKLSMLRHAKWSPNNMWLAAWSSLRDQAILKFGFYTARRPQEIAELDAPSVKWSDTDKGFWIHIVKSKTDQLQAGRKIFWPESLGTLALKKYLGVRERLLKQCADRWDTETAVFVNLSGARIGHRMSVESIRKVLKKRIPVPPGSDLSGVPSLRRGGAEWWLQCQDSEKARLIAKSMGGWKSFQMLDNVYRDSEPTPALIHEVSAKRPKTEASSSAFPVTGVLVDPSTTSTPITAAPSATTLIGCAQKDVDHDNGRKKVIADIGRVDDHQVPGLVLESLVNGILALNKSKKNTVGWSSLKKFRCYDLLKREIIAENERRKKAKENKENRSAQGSVPEIAACTG